MNQRVSTNNMDIVKEEIGLEEEEEEKIQPHEQHFEDQVS